MIVKLSDGSYVESGTEYSVISGMVVDDTEDFSIAANGVPPPPLPEIPWAVIVAAVGVAIVVTGVVIAIRR